MPLFYTFLRRIRHWRSLPAPDRWATLEAVVFFGAFRMGLRLAPDRLLQPFLTALRPVPAAPEPAGRMPLPPAAVAVRRALYRVGRGYTDACLPLALAGRAMLHRRGLPSSLSLGVARPSTAGAHRFHAWLRCRGHVVTGGEADSHYAVLGTVQTLAPNGPLR